MIILSTMSLRDKTIETTDVVNKWKDKIDPRAYEALMNWTINIDD